MSTWILGDRLNPCRCSGIADLLRFAPADSSVENVVRCRDCGRQTQVEYSVSRAIDAWNHANQRPAAEPKEDAP